MGLDMYLAGEDFIHYAPPEMPKPTVVCSWLKENHKLEIKKVEFDLGYWRKHPDLHGYIVEKFAEGVDECQEIWMNLERLNQLRDAIENDNLAHGTTGFFFGASPAKDSASLDELIWYREQKEEDLKIIDRAIEYLKEEPEGIWRSVTYRASW